MKSITRVSAILAVASIAFFSCKKDKKGPDNNPGNPTTKITRIEENGVTTGTFEYNTDGTLKKATSVISPSSQMVFTFTYDAGKKVTEIVTNGGYKAKYMYENGVIKGAENFQNGEKFSENIFTYENGRIKTNTVFTAFPQGGGVITYKPTFRIVFTYLPNGNVDKAESFHVNPETNQQTLEFAYRYKQYDDMVSPTAGLSDFTRVLFYQPTHKNNPLVEEFIGEDGSVEETTTHEYTYDATTKLPLTLRSTTTVVGGTPTVINVKFFY
jgi:antitoxin component YwqK of YwqJK toxin-antitoxin module